MALAKLFHNPGAGDEEHDRKKLIALIESQGFECRYSSTKKKGWEKIEPDIDFLIVAGGDGTVRKVAAQYLSRTLVDKKYPLALLPLGTANNIAKTLELGTDIEKLIASWSQGTFRKIDVGLLDGVDEQKFFLESFGYGLFPRLMKTLRKMERKEDMLPEEKIKMALLTLHDLILTYKPKKCRMKVDGTDHSGDYLLVEVMNTRLMGPNLHLAPQADPSDGILNIALLPESQRDAFASYLVGRLNGKTDPFPCEVVTGKSICLEWEGADAHVDDEVIKLEKATKVGIKIQEGVLDFLVPGH
ncbi:diacylglycerol kinase family lipid kinase [Rhabdobacter roseus]|uniref:Diacylglycerol kinase family enzyme n=1 Tax=Rhabdobacter roseus TaxID=1655419 RepID=A0A840TNZ0_9BACT|nr:diacylglycerol kinase family protein [Rhabdobacter roseus]MBB5284645.1 diacylglycerol kinase family enzyme [Rhabdobacter roseus]